MAKAFAGHAEPFAGVVLSWREVKGSGALFKVCDSVGFTGF